MNWAPWVQEHLDAIEDARAKSPAWQRAEREWFNMTFLFQKGIVVEFRKSPRQRAKEGFNAA